MGVTVEALIRAGIPADEIVAVGARDEPADTWPTGLKRRPVRAAPAAVVAAESAETVSSVLRAAAAAGATVQVEGARTNVVGCLDGSPDVVLRLAMDSIVDLDAISQVVTAQAGVAGGILEDYLNERGFTLGHDPQSLEHSTVGGWIATRATGTASARFGGVERTVCGLEGVLPSGEAFRIPGPAPLARRPRRPAAPVRHRGQPGGDHGRFPGRGPAHARCQGQRPGARFRNRSGGAEGAHPAGAARRRGPPAQPGRDGRDPGRRPRPCQRQRLRSGAVTRRRAGRHRDRPTGCCSCHRRGGRDHARARRRRPLVGQPPCRAGADSGPQPRHRLVLRHHRAGRTVAVGRRAGRRPAG